MGWPWKGRIQRRPVDQMGVHVGIPLSSLISEAFRCSFLDWNLEESRSPGEEVWGLEIKKWAIRKYIKDVEAVGPCRSTPRVT